MPEAASKAKKLTEEQKNRIFFLANQGTDVRDIAKEMGLPVPKVHGYIQSCINFGKLNPDVARPNRVNPQSQAASLPPEILLMPPTDSAPLPPVSPAQEAPPAPVSPAPAPAYRPPPAPVRVTQAPPPVQRVYSDGFQEGRSAQGYNGGWNNPQQIVRYQIERKVPNDGIIGQHTAPFTEMDLCQMYGEGLYRVLRYEPGRPVPMEFDVKVGQNFGAPKYPRQGVSGGESRPGYGRTWGQQNRYDRDRQDEEEPRRAPSFGHDRQLSDYAARPQPVVVQDGSASVASSAIDALSRANERAINQADKARENGPDNFLSNFMKGNQELQNERWDRERTLAEERRKEERSQADANRKDEQDRWERRQKERDQDHQRELERIRTEGEAKAAVAREERKMIMDLEDKKLEVIRQEHRIRQDQMAEELRLSREQSKLTEERLSKQLAEVRSETEKQITDAQESLKADSEREKTQLDREFDLRKGGMEKEQQLNEKILEIRGEQLQQQGGNEVFNTINTLIKEFSKGLEKVVELKKVQSSSPEAQVAMVAAGATSQPASEGNVKPEVEERPEAEAGKPAAKSEQGGNVNMEKLIQDMMDEPFFKEVMKEWALHVEEEADPTTFANMYLEWMRDPNRHEARQACSMFANVMKVRNWKRMFAILEPKLSADIVIQFKKPFATDFYDGFKAMVLEQIRAYWQGFLEDQQKRDAEKKAGNGHPAAAPAAPAAQGPKAIEDEVEEPEAPPVPTRESLRSKSAV